MDKLEKLRSRVLRIVYNDIETNTEGFLVKPSVCSISIGNSLKMVTELFKGGAHGSGMPDLD